MGVRNLGMNLTTAFGPTGYGDTRSTPSIKLERDDKPTLQPVYCHTQMRYNNFHSFVARVDNPPGSPTLDELTPSATMVMIQSSNTNSNKGSQ
ncbi:hypothetical protein N7454_008157 [Penicillium verhagenii]|nr:hypothetical protein N7454_008157 [Penicillium verhagenii]